MNQEIKNLLIKNIFPKSLAAVGDIELFPWHKDKFGSIDTYKIQSSQALMIDVFGYLSICKDKDIVINKLFNLNENNWQINFEYSNSELLHESTSSQIDVILTGDENIILIECKFTEKDGGACSQKNKIKRLNKPQCTGNYEEQTNPANNIKSKCALSGKNIDYWKFIPFIYDYKNSDEYKPCPFKDGNYQWMRNLCFAYALRNSSKKNVKSYICYDDADFCEMKKKFDKNHLSIINKHVKPEYRFELITYQKIIDTGIAFSSKSTEWKELKNWILKKESEVRKLKK